MSDCLSSNDNSIIMINTVDFAIEFVTRNNRNTQRAPNTLLRHLEHISVPCSSK